MRKRNLIATLGIVLLGTFSSGCSAETISSEHTATASPKTENPVQETPTTPNSVSEAPPERTVVEILNSLQGLSIDAFFEQSFNQLSLRNPEGLTHAGVSALFGLRDDQLNNLSDAYHRDTQKLETGILERLLTYDQDSLTLEQQISYNVYAWYLDNQVRGHEFMYHNYPLTHFIGSYHFELDNLLTEVHPLKTRANAEDYIARLSKVSTQVNQLMEGLQIREEMGVIPPDFILTLTRDELLNYLGIYSVEMQVNTKSLRVYTRFDEEIEGIPGLSDQEKTAFREAVRGAIEVSLIPAFLKLIEYQDHLLPLTTPDAGAWKLPNGEAYYAYMLHQETSTDLTPPQIHALGLAEVERIQEELRQALIELEYPEEASLRENFQLAIDVAGYYDVNSPSSQANYIHSIEKIIDEADTRVSDLFDLRPRGEVVVLGGPMGGYYVPGTPDGSRPGSYHVSTGGGYRPKYSAQTIAYHETIPGHHYQIALAQELDLPAFRNFIHFNGYVEGWALYAERLAWEMGLYDDSPYGNLGRLQYELLRAVRLVVDTGIHAMGWTRAEAQGYMDQAMPTKRGWYYHEIDRYIVLPAQATGYKVGMLKILELRQQVRDVLGEKFDIKEFHNVVIGNGSLPLEILEGLVGEYTEANASEAFNGTGEIIAYTSEQDGNMEIYLMDVNSGKTQRLTDHPAEDYWPTWSPDGAQLAFTSNRGGDFKIYTINLDGSILQRLTDTAANDLEPDWSPDGTQIAFMVYENIRSSIYVMASDGRDRQQLTDGLENDYLPKWSPDGTQIVFVSERDGNPEIYVMNADGSNPRRLTDNLGDDLYPSWSSDGNHISFYSERDEGDDLYVLDLDSDEQYSLTDDNATVWVSDWSPDGGKIAFTSTRDGNREIYVLSFDDGSLNRLTDNYALDGIPAWRP